MKEDNKAWPTIALGEIMRSPQSLDPRKYPNTEYSLFSIPAYDNGAPEITSGNKIGSSKKALQENDVLLSKIVPHIRRSWVVKNQHHPMLGSSEWIIFNDPRVNPEYLRHYLLSDGFHAAFMSTVSGVGGSLNRARPSVVSNIKVPLPPVEEQRKIANLFQLINLTIKKCTQYQLLLDSLVRESVRQSTQSSTATIPLSSISIIKGGITPPKKNNSYWNGDVNWFTTKDLKHDKIHESLEQVTEKAITETSLAKIPQSSIAISLRGMSLAHRVPISIIPTGSTINQDLKSVSPKNGTYSTFILFHLIKQQEKYLLSKSSSSAHGTKKLDSSHLSSLQIPIMEKSTVNNLERLISRIENMRSLNSQRLVSAKQLHRSLTIKFFT